jgi:hypothetical protein
MSSKRANLSSLLSEDLRNRFVKAETTLFRVRYEEEADAQERQQFLNSRDFNWITVSSALWTQDILSKPT